MMWTYLWRTIYLPQTTNWQPDRRITKSVNCSITLLNSFHPTDPCRTLILAPAFVTGCAAFEPQQRDAIRKTIGAVKAYMGFRNSDSALELLEEVWRLMGAKNERSWDRQGVANTMGLDFLAT
jgi:hypothetical protein